MLEEKVLATIIKNKLIENGDKIVLGVSGGPDSLSMLNVLYNFMQEKKFQFEIFVAHINHGLRENAIIDEKFVKEFCENKNIKCFIDHADINKMAKEQGKGLEETGRNERYRFFDEVLKATDSNKIAIAHNNNDHVETVIMNIVRGSGLSGLKGIEARNGKYIRPLIDCKREEIEEYCDELQLNPRHDESNDVNVYTRNKIRNIAIPFIKNELNPNIIDTITRLSEIARDDIEYLDMQTEEAYKDMLLYENFDINDMYDEEIGPKVVLNLKKFNAQNKAIEKRIILYSINKLFGTTKGIEKVHIEDILKLCNNNIGNKFLSPNKETKIVIKNKKIYLKRQK